MKKYINKIIALLLLIEGLYLLYSFALIFIKFISTFTSSNMGSVYILAVYVATIILFIVASIGLLRNKNWAIICGWVAMILPQLLKLVVPFAQMPLQNNYLVLVINVLVLLYLSTQWGKLKTSQ